MTEWSSFLDRPDRSEIEFARELIDFRGSPQQLFALYERAGTVLGRAIAEALIARL